MISKNKKKILLVGGCGFIGHNLALKLKFLGNEVYVFDGLAVNNLISFNGKNIKNKKLYTTILQERINLLNENDIQLHVEDARNYHALSKTIEDISPDIIIHLAAISHANESNKNPHNTFDHSLRTLENSLDNCRDKKIHLIYISSSMVYGNFKSKEALESDRCCPLGIYGNLKLAGELIVKSYHQVFDMPYTIIRPSALYGERCVSRRVGQIFIENALYSTPITVSGDPGEKLDFTYIEDLISGISLCCEKEQAINETFNITYGNSRSLEELINVLTKEFSNIKVEYKNRDKFTPIRGTLNIDKAKKLLDYKPEYPIEIGYKNYINWYKEFYKKL